MTPPEPCRQCEVSANLLRMIELIIGDLRTGDARGWKRLRGLHAAIFEQLQMYDADLAAAEAAKRKATRQMLGTGT
ncbi:MAG: hypothetical protein ACREDG_00125 [Methylocella sp.]